MKTEINNHSWKTMTALLCLTALVLFLISLVSYGMGRSEEPSAKIEGAALPNFLGEFVFVPGSAVLAGDRLVVALYENPRNGFHAMVMFKADCVSGGCALGEVIAFSIVDRQGKDVELAGYPQVKRPEVAGQLV